MSWQRVVVVLAFIAAAVASSALGKDPLAGVALGAAAGLVVPVPPPRDGPPP